MRTSSSNAQPARSCALQVMALSRDAPLASENGNLPLLSVSASRQLSVVGVVCGRRDRLSSRDLTSTDTCRADIRL